MKKKTTTITLLLVCLVVWGTIGWKVYSALQEDSPATVRMAKVPEKPKKDSVALLLNYRDPFMGEYAGPKDQPEEPSPPPAVQTEVLTEQPQEEPLPEFQYKGIIRMGKITQAIVSQNGESLMLKAKEKIGEFSILQITDSKLVVGRKNKKYELSIQ